MRNRKSVLLKILCCAFRINTFTIQKTTKTSCLMIYSHIGQPLNRQNKTLPQALFAAYGADIESSDGDDDKKNWLPDPGMIGSGG